MKKNFTLQIIPKSNGEAKNTKEYGWWAAKWKVMEITCSEIFILVDKEKTGYQLPSIYSFGYNRSSSKNFVQTSREADQNQSYK